MVNGFRAGEYNRFSRHWTVRQYDAHSWVEAWFPPYGWIEFDPTPPAPALPGSAFAPVSRFVDALELWWTEDVINYDLRKQSYLLRLGRDSLRAAQRAARNAWAAAGDFLGALPLPQWARSPSGLILTAIAFLLGAIVLKFRKPRAVKRRLRLILAKTPMVRNRAAAVLDFYREALDLLRSRGWEKAPGMTPLEYANRLARTPYGGTLSDITGIYYRVRFGNAVQAGDFAQARVLLRTLKRQKR